MEFWSDGAKTLTNKIRNPKLEIRNKPKYSNSQSKSEIPNEPCLEFCAFDHLDLFRDSDFEFRVFPAFHFLGVPFDFRDHMLCATPGPS